MQRCRYAVSCHSVVTAHGEQSQSIPMAAIVWSLSLQRLVRDSMLTDCLMLLRVLQTMKSRDRPPRLHAPLKTSWHVTMSRRKLHTCFVP